jgi:hypothetical protein
MLAAVEALFRTLLPWVFAMGSVMGALAWLWEVGTEKRDL